MNVTPDQMEEYIDAVSDSVARSYRLVDYLAAVVREKMEEHAGMLGFKVVFEGTRLHVKEGK